MKTRLTLKNLRTRAVTMTFVLALPLSLVLGITGCAGDRYHRSTGEFVDDNAVKARVSSALADNPDYKFKQVQVTVFKGTVQLSGFVDLSAQKTRAGEIVKAVPGVQSLENDITVQSPSSSNSSTVPVGDDDAIAARVKDALHDNPEYKFDGVKVNVAGGVAQLSGFVNAAGQKERAEELAEKVPGVTKVVNALIVKDDLEK